MTAKVLIIDDEEVIRLSCVRILEEGDYETDVASNGFDGLTKIKESSYDVLILDIMMPKIDGLEVLQRVKESYPEIAVIMVTGLSQIETAVQSMKLGAFDYIPKPFDPDQLLDVVERACARRRQLDAASDDQDKNSTYHFESIIGSSEAMQQVFSLIAKGAPTNSTVLITGDSGTGKELVAQAIHYNSLRRNQPFIPVDCASLTESLLESELFGHVKGAFTGAVGNKKGLFESADGGTLFLDEVSNISRTTQAKLLRVIQSREFKPVGGAKLLRTNIRLVAATNRDLRDLVAAGSFREDLFYRINTFPITMPPLRERGGDITLLANHFLRTFCEELERTPRGFSDEALNLLESYDWPGNVRELENTIHRAAIVAGDQPIRRGHLLDILDGTSRVETDIPRTGEELKQTKKIARQDAVKKIERSFVLEALKRNGWNVTRSAEETGMQRSNFQALMKKHGVRIRSRSDED